MNIRRINRRLKKRFGPAVTATLTDGCIVLSGQLPAWAETVEACSLAAGKYSTTHVVNDIRCDEAGEQSIRIPTLRDTALEGRKPDVLIIGGGISGASIARELSKWNLDILLVEKEADLALQASGRNDGEVHPGIDLSRGSLKHHYVRRGNAMYDQLCRELDVPFKRVGSMSASKKPGSSPSLPSIAASVKIGMASPIPSSSPGGAAPPGAQSPFCLRHLQSRPPAVSVPMGLPSPMPKTPCRTVPRSR